jgi:hypothetical protein
MSVSNGIDVMSGLCRRQEIVARIVELLKERYPQVAAATIAPTPAPPGSAEIPLAILLREPVAEPDALCQEIRRRLELVTGAGFSVEPLSASGGPDDAGLLRRGRLILDRDPRFRADYTWAAGQREAASAAAGSRA